MKSLASRPVKPLTKLDRLEARVEALEFLVLTLMRSSRDDEDLKCNVVSTLGVLEHVLNMPEFQKKSDYARACLEAYLDTVHLTWDNDLPVEAQSGAVH
jgi:hypothetical protein